MELKLISEKESSVRKVIIYEIGEYEIRFCDYDDFIEFEIKNHGNRFTPNITANIDSNIICGFNVETTSYDQITLDELIEIADKLKVAAEVVKILTNKFVK